MDPLMNNGPDVLLLENNGILPNEQLNIDLVPLNILTRE